MDYQAFYNDIVDWIHKANQGAMKYGIGHEDFWTWVADSSGALCEKYQDNRLAILQMRLLGDWLEEAYEKQKTCKN